MKDLRAFFSGGLVALLSLAMTSGLASQANAQGKRQDRRSQSRVRSIASQRAPRLLYVWDSTIPSSTKETRSLLRFARTRRISTIAIEASPIGYGGYGDRDALRDYARFVEAAHAQRIQVFALGGYSWFTVSPDAGVPGQPTSWLEGWSLYESIAGSGLFDGVVDDSQPHETSFVKGDGTSGNYFWDSTPDAAADYLQWLQGLDERLGDDLPFYLVTPVWFDSDERLTELYLDGESVPHALSDYVARIADLVIVSAYRDRADRILGESRGELDTGRCLLGVETQDRGPELASTTFYEEGLLRMEWELFVVERRLRGESNFEGFAIHHYESYRELRRGGRRNRR